MPETPETPEQPDDKIFRRDQDFDPNLARFIGEVVRHFGVTADEVSGMINPRYRSAASGDVSALEASSDFFKHKTNRSQRPDEQ